MKEIEAELSEKLIRKRVGRKRMERGKTKTTIDRWTGDRPLRESLKGTVK